MSALLLALAALLVGAAGEASDELAHPTFQAALTSGTAFHQRADGAWESEEYVGGRATLHVPLVARRLYAWAEASIESASSELVFDEPGTWRTLRGIGGLAVDVLRFESGHVGLVVGAGSQVAVEHTPEPLDGIPDLYGAGVRYRARRGGHLYLGWIRDRGLGVGWQPRLSLRMPSPVPAIEIDIEVIPTAELPVYRVLLAVPFR